MVIAVSSMLTLDYEHNHAATQSTKAQRWTFFAVVSLGLLMIGLDNRVRPCLRNKKTNNR